MNGPASNAVSMADWLTRTVQAAGIERTLKAGQVLFRIGHRTAGFYEVVTGTIRLVRVDRAGREAVLHIAVAGETLAEASLFAPAYHCDAIATTDAVVRLYPKAVVLAEFERNPKAAQAFMAMLARQVMTLRTHLELRNIHSARDRVRHYLALNAGTDGRTVVVRGTLKDLANELGLTHEALYRTLADMAAAGEIERRKGKIMLT
jgi:CRP/FNR family transcriptional regulator, dissimilatory nitrate respiration regulator